MKTRTAIIAAILLGLFTYTIPLYAGDRAYHVEERTVIDIPIVGKITTLTSSHFAGCKLKEQTTIKMHNTLVKAMSSSRGKSHSVELTDLCEEKQWKYMEDEQSYKAYSFDELKAEYSSHDDHEASEIDIAVDQNDMDDLPRITREFQGTKKNINGMKASKVVTWVYTDEESNPIMIEEYYSTRSKAIAKVNSAREDVQVKLGKINDVEGVPEFIKMIYQELQEDQEWARPDGEVVRLSIKLLDKEDDPLFSMVYDVTTSEIIDYNEDHFVLN